MCQKNRRDCLIFMTFPAFLPILWPLRGIGRAAPILLVEPDIFGRTCGVHFSSLPPFLPYSPTFAGGVKPWLKYQGSLPGVNQSETSFSVGILVNVCAGA